MKFEWIVKHISAVGQVKYGETTKDKITVCLEEAGDKQYPEKLAVDFIGNGIDCITQVGLEVWDHVIAYINPNYNRYPDKITGEEKIFNAIKGWKIDMIEKGAYVEAPKADDDSLPF